MSEFYLPEYVEDWEDLAHHLQSIYSGDYSAHNELDAFDSGMAFALRLVQDRCLPFQQCCKPTNSSAECTSPADVDDLCPLPSGNYGPFQYNGPVDTRFLRGLIRHM